MGIEVTPTPMQHITCNITGSARRDSIGPQEHLVVPVTIIVPGVLNGNRGPILYSADENKKNVEAWNHVPLTDDHPQENISARSAKVLKNQYLGVLLNAFTNSQGELKGEAWFNIEATEARHPGSIKRMESGEKIELSTGLGLDTKATPGVTNSGEVYDSIAENYRPDHLAILFHKRGACSVKDGCGVNNEENKEGKICKCHETVFHLTNAKLSHDEIRSKLSDELNKKTSLQTSSISPVSHLWIQEVFDKHLIYEDEGEVFKVGYSIDKSGDVKLESPVKVEKKVKYVPVSNESENQNSENTPISSAEKETESQITNCFSVLKGLDTMADFDREVVITGLIANCDCYQEDDKGTLNEFSDDQLKRIVKHEAERISNERKLTKLLANASDDPEEEDEDEESNDPKKKGKKEKGKAMNEAGIGLAESPKTIEEFFASAPPEVLEVFNEAKKISEGRKVALVEKLVANAADDQKETLTATYNSMATPTLETLVAALPQESETEAQAQNYFGTPAPSQTTNSQTTEPIPPAVLVFD